ncbi:metalloregulator ArsR/SmtB family transcription factor [Modestobacter sp. I12A-02628]|uniref:Winged helix-turn-helix transcriptional regulator n=1 Tax=Goekera deserti TaxID=2497753 RepID=A0A7K3WD02_9ACTN|nr:metalloregulator ArsR/SmtB family transcription factor [Goekera deserti]MPQ96901.1 metalloregulator ArsR/SmtB family transcription factor [Goekera deserti]NDI46786.1 metalloregulator ArsR/SmtB family transcription factor [Goekera deserti]NEL54355.1 winged helix-turn-helix transcriptional regulator [Goekera deserti]
MPTAPIDQRGPGHETALTHLIDDMAVTGRFFSVLADPTRLAILRLLLQREHSVGELVESLGVSQSRVSNHLACLRWCEFVTVERQARRAIYRIADTRLADVLNAADRLSGDMCDHLSSCTRIGPAWI